MRLQRLSRQADLEVTCINKSLNQFEGARKNRIRYDDLERDAESIEVQRAALLDEQAETELKILQKGFEMEIAAVLVSSPELKALVSDKAL